MLIVGHVFAIRSERRICTEVQVNLACRWFCRLGIEDKIPDHSMFSRAQYDRFSESDARASGGGVHLEYYREKVRRNGTIRTMHHFVNGGGGAYLSIGTALDFPKLPDVADWAFYPRADRLREKMDAEMPIWKQPFWYWIRWFKAWPFSVEALSGMFDFNDAPFFQSFVQVRVERSKKRMVLILNGVDGPLRWRDLQIGGAWFPTGSSLSDPVEFIVPMDRE